MVWNKNKIWNHTPYYYYYLLKLSKVCKNHMNDLCQCIPLYKDGFMQLVSMYTMRNDVSFLPVASEASVSGGIQCERLYHYYQSRNTLPYVVAVGRLSADESINFNKQAAFIIHNSLKNSYYRVECWKLESEKRKEWKSFLSVWF